MDEPTLLDKIKALERPGDVAVFLIVGASAYVIDAAFNPVGFLSAHQTGFVAGSAALGVKRGIEDGLAKRRERKAQRQKSCDEQKRAAELHALLSKDEQSQALVQRLSRERELFELGIINVDDFKASVDEVIKAYRDRSEGQRKLENYNLGGEERVL